MDAGHSNLLDNCYFDLVKDMNPVEVTDYLRAKGIFNAQHASEIMNKSDFKARNRELLSRLTEGGPNAFATFVEALKVTNQPKLAALLSDGAQPLTAASTKDSDLGKLRTLTPPQFKMALTKSLQFICDNLQIDEVLIIMEGQGAIRKVPLAEIMAGQTFYERNRRLVDHIQKSSQNTFNTFIKALLETDQKDIADEIAKKV